MLKETIATVMAFAAAVGLVSCQSMHFDKIPQNTGFFQHLQMNPYKDMPVDAYWVSENISGKEWDRRVTGENIQGVRMCVTPVSLNYLVNRPSSTKELEEIMELKHYFDRALLKELRKLSADTGNNFHLVQQGGPGVFTIESAILSVTPTVTDMNTAMEVIGAVAGTAGAVANYAMGKDEDKGSICIGTRFRDPSGRVVCEFAKYMPGQSSILGYDLKDFQSYAHQKSSIDDWVELMGESCISKFDEKISMPWFKINPF